MNGWMPQARERLHAWRDHMTTAKREADALSHFQNFTVSQPVILIICL